MLQKGPRKSRLLHGVFFGSFTPGGFEIMETLQLRPVGFGFVGSS